MRRAEVQKICADIVTKFSSSIVKFSQKLSFPIRDHGLSLKQRDWDQTQSVLHCWTCYFLAIFCPSCSCWWNECCKSGVSSAKPVMDDGVEYVSYELGTFGSSIKRAATKSARKLCRNNAGRGHNITGADKVTYPSLDSENKKKNQVSKLPLVLCINFRMRQLKMHWWTFVSAQQRENPRQLIDQTCYIKT